MSPKALGSIELSTGRPSLSGGAGRSEVNGEDRVNVDFLVSPGRPDLEKIASPKIDIGTIGVSTGDPTLSVTLAKVAPATKALGTIAISTGTPVLNSPTLTKDTPDTVEIASPGSGEPATNYERLIAIEDTLAIRFTSNAAAQEYWELSPSAGTLLDSYPSGMFTDTSIFWIERFGVGHSGTRIRLHKGGSSVNLTSYLTGLSDEHSWVIIDESTQTWLMMQANVLNSTSVNFGFIDSPYTEVASELGSAASTTAWLNDLASRELVVGIVPNNTFRPFAAAEAGAPIGITTGDPALNSPTLTKQMAANKELGTIAVTTGTPTLNSPTLAKVAPATKALGTIDVSTGNPTLSVTLAKVTPATKALGTIAISTGTPVLNSPTLTKDTPDTVEIASPGSGEPATNYERLIAIEDTLAIRFTSNAAAQEYWELSPSAGTLLDSYPSGMFTDTSIFWIERFGVGHSGTRIRLHKGGSSVNLTSYLTGLSDEHSWVIIDESTQTWLMMQANVLNSTSVNFGFIDSPYTEVASELGSAASTTAWLNDLASRELVVGIVPNNTFRPFAAAEAGAPIGITTGDPALNSPTLTKQMAANKELGTIAVTTGDPTLSSPTLAKDTPATKALGAIGISTGAPTLNSPTLAKRIVDNEELGTISVTTGDPILNSPTLAKDTPATKVLGAITVTTGDPALNSPTLTKQAAATKELGTIGVTTGEPALNSPALTKQTVDNKELGTIAVSTGAPTFSSPILTKDTPATKVLGALAVSTGDPALSTPSLAKVAAGNKDLGTIDVSVGDPTLNAPTLAKDTPVTKGLGTIGVTTGDPTLNAPTLTKDTPVGKDLGAVAITTGSPTLSQPSLGKQEAAIKAITATIAVGAPTLTVDLTKQTPAVKALTVEITTGTPSLNHVNLDKIENDPTSLGSITVTTGAPTMAVTLDKIEAGSAIVATIQAGSGDTELAEGITIDQVQVFNDASGVVVHRDGTQSFAQWARTAGRGLSFYFICDEGTLEFPVGLATATASQIEWGEAHDCMVLSSGEEMRMVVASSGGLGIRGERRPLIAGAMPEPPP